MSFPRRQLCVVHGEKTKPHACGPGAQVRFIHRNRLGGADKCHNCGECCHVSVEVDPKSKKGKAMIARIREQGRILKRVGVEPEKVIKLIEQDGRMPIRSHVDAGDLQGNVFLPSSVCSLLVPEEYFDEHFNKRRKRE